MSTREPIDARSIFATRTPAAAIAAIAAFGDVLKQAEAEVYARQDLGAGRAGSLRNARRLARRRLDSGPDPGRFGRPPSIEVRRKRKALRRKLARSC